MHYGVLFLNELPDSRPALRLLRQPLEDGVVCAPASPPATSAPSSSPPPAGARPPSAAKPPAAPSRSPSPGARSICARSRSPARPPHRSWST